VGDQEEELEGEEIELQLKKIKKKKRTGVEGILGEALLYNGQIRERFKVLLKRISKGEFSGRMEERSDNSIERVKGIYKQTKNA